MNYRLLRASLALAFLLGPAPAFAELRHVTIKVLGMD
jgi:hypothetical protein